MSLAQQIKIAHNCYFSELKGIATVVELIKYDGCSNECLLSELERRIKDFAETIKECGINLVREAA